jgi:Acetoacetate decarboxylase (ADC)
MSDHFFDVDRTIHNTSAGLVDLPILYRDASNVIALFDADARGAAELLAGTGLEPAIVHGDKALVGLSFYEYRATTVGVYNEVGTAIFARRAGDRSFVPGLADMLLPPSRRSVGAWVVDLPVTTEAANAAGRELWGYPKFVTRIDFALAGRRVRSTVWDPAAASEICELAGEMGPGLPSPSMSLVTFSRLGDALVRTHVDVRAPTWARARGDVRLRVGASTHRMAENLRTLGLDGARPRALLVTDHFQSLLHAGRRVA